MQGPRVNHKIVYEDSGHSTRGAQNTSASEEVPRQTQVAPPPYKENILATEAV